MNEKMYMSEEKNVSIKSISSNSLIAGYIWEFQIYGDRIFTIDVTDCMYKSNTWVVNTDLYTSINAIMLLQNNYQRKRYCWQKSYENEFLLSKAVFESLSQQTWHLN